MVLDQPTNFSRGETTSSIASTDTTIDVANASTFGDPATGEYNLVLWDQTQYPRPTASGASPEIVRVTGRDTTADALTVSRGQEGTAAGSFPSGAALIHTQTAKTFGDIDSTFASFWDATNQELTADINATNGDIDSLNTASATIGGHSAYQEIHRETGDVGNTTFNWGLDQRHEYILKVNLSLETGTEVFLRFNSENTQKYTFYDSSGTKQSDQTELLICRSDSSFGEFSAEIHLSPATFRDAKSAWGYTSLVEGHWPDRISEFSRSGTTQNAVSVVDPNLNIHVDGAILDSTRQLITLSERVL